MTTEISEKPILFSAPMVRAILDGRKTQTRRVIKGPIPDGATSCGVFSTRDDTLNGRWQFLDGDPEDADSWGWIGEDFACPYGKPGNRLWVRETWGLHNTQPKDGPDGAHVYFRATDGERHELRHQLWRPSIFMPRWASRLTLEITDIRVERLQEISEEDAIAEGFKPGDGSPVNGFDTESPYSARAAFAGLWEKLNGKRGICKTCKGHGVVPAWSGSIEGGSLARDSKDCPDCKGESRGFGWDQNPWVWVVEFKRLEDQ